MNAELEKLHRGLVGRLLTYDTGQKCDFCSKVTWGEKQHDPECPYALAYQIARLNMIESGFQEVQNYLDKHPLEYCWEYGAALTYDQVDRLLKMDEYATSTIENELFSFMSGAGLSWHHEKAAIERAIEETENEEYADEIMDRYPVVYWDMQARALVKSTRTHLTLRLMPMTESWINSDNIWSNIVEVNPGGLRRPKLVSTADRIELANNSFYDGPLVALLSSDTLVQIWDWIEQGKIDKDTEVILKPGAMVTIHNYAMGSSSIIVPTIAPIKASIHEIAHDGANRYGVQACCGLVEEAWNGELELVEE